MSARRSRPQKPSRTSRPAGPSGSPGLTPNAQLLLLFAGLLAVTLIAYYPVWHGGFLWDDDAHITKPALRSAHGLWRIWFEGGATQQYYPIAHSAFWLMQKLWG